MTTNTAGRNLNTTPSYTRAAPQTTSQQPDLNSLYGTDRVTIGESNRGFAEQLLLADCLGDAACTGMDSFCSSNGF